MPDALTQEFIALRDQYIESCFAKLNPVQRQAVFATEGPLLILAGAGSGKTTVLVNRIANIIRFGKAHGSKTVSRAVTQEDVDHLKATMRSGRAPSLDHYTYIYSARPWNVLAITFTNKAAGELKDRLKAMLGDTVGGDVNASTFHSACVRILRRDAERIGFPKSFTIYDADDQLRVIKQIYKELLIDDKFLPPKSAIARISGYKDKLLSAADVAAEAPSDTKAALVSKIYTAYAARLKSAGAMDFDDLIFYTVQMLKNDAEAREYYQNKFRYVVVDEYQDTSIAQFHLVRLLAGGTNNVCVVGDDDQSIYKFRGATIENILNFEQVFRGAQTIRLEQNYRSTSNILNAANSVIQNNNGRKGKTLWTENGDGDKVHHYTASSEQDEASHIAEVIGENLRAGARLRDHAVLYRMNAQSNPVETYFARAGIPYRIVGGQRFFDRKEVKDINSYLAVISNPRDDVRLRRIINEPARKIGPTTVDKIAELAAGRGVSMLQVIAEASTYPALARAAGPLNAFYEMYRELCDLAITLPLDEFAGEVIRKTGYEAMLKAQKEERRDAPRKPGPAGQLGQDLRRPERRGRDAGRFPGGSRADLGPRFLRRGRRFGHAHDHPQRQGARVPVCLSHRHGGTAFSPATSRATTRKTWRRSAACAMSASRRAKKELYLSSSRSRMIFGRTQRNPPSCFLSEIDPGVLEESESPELAFGGGFGAGYGSYSAHVPGGRSGYSGASRGYLNSEYNGGFGSRYGGRSGFAASGGHESPARRRRRAHGAGRRFRRGGTGLPRAAPPQPGRAARPCWTPSRPRPKRRPGYAPGDLVEHKVFGRGKVLKVTPMAGDSLVEVQFDRVGVKKTLANYAPMTKCTAE